MRVESPTSHETDAALERWLLPIIAVFGLAVAFQSLIPPWNFVIDDYYISARYAKMLTSGHGLTYNSMGEMVEGYSNFLWTLLLAVIQLLAGATRDITPIVKFIGAASFLGMILGAAFIAKQRCEEPPELLRAISHPARRILWIVLLATYTPYAYYAVSGMETIFVSLLVAMGVFFWIRRGEPNWITMMFFMLTALARIDGVLIFGLCGLAMLFQWLWLKKKFWAYVKLAAIPTIIYILYQAGRIAYYGELLPNPFYAKISSTGAERLTPYSSFAGFL
ncbi:hypothetical protein KQI84_00525 [bacterium]|nr:hypothetical protein [bacterium]